MVLYSRPLEDARLTHAFVGGTSSFCEIGLFDRVTGVSALNCRDSDKIDGLLMRHSYEAFASEQDIAHNTDVLSIREVIFHYRITG